MRRVGASNITFDEYTYIFLHWLSLTGLKLQHPFPRQKKQMSLHYRTLAATLLQKAEGAFLFKDTGVVLLWCALERNLKLTFICQEEAQSSYRWNWFGHNMQPGDTDG